MSAGPQEIPPHVAFPVVETSQVGEVRRYVTNVARQLGYDETQAGNVSIVATELANNLVRHAREGLVLVRPLPAAAGVELMAIDSGPGMTDTAWCLRDGNSSGGTAGKGLGAVQRLARQFDLYSQPGVGTSILARFWREQAADLPEKFGAVRTPYPGETVCGDGYAQLTQEDRRLVLIVDGLGHGVAAAEAARAAIHEFQRLGFSRTPGELLESLHQALRPTRGAAAAIAEFDSGRRVIRYAGIGNTAAVLLHEHKRQGFVSLSGTLGHAVRKFQEFHYSWPAGTEVVLSSDGIKTQWSLDKAPGLLRCEPTLAAATIYKMFHRTRDDATVVVVTD